MIANLIALLEKVGPQAMVLITYLIDHKDQITGLIELLMTLFQVPPVPPAKQAVSEGDFIDAVKKAGGSTGDAQELLAAMPE